MISDYIFSAELDKHLKAQGYSKPLRTKIIKQNINDPTLDRDACLEHYLEAAREYKESKKVAVLSEAQEQMNFVERWRKTYHNDLCFMIRNDGSRTPREKVEQVAMGLHAGVSDLFIPRWKIFLEMKRANGKDSDQSEKQQTFENYVKNNGYFYLLGFGCEDAWLKCDAIIKNS